MQNQLDITSKIQYNINMNEIIIKMKQEGYTNADIGEVLGISDKAVSMRATRLKKRGLLNSNNRLWTSEELDQLKDLRSQGFNNADIALFLSMDHQAVKTKASQLIKAGIIKANSGVYSSIAPKSTVQELLQYVVNYPVKDNCPNPYKSRIVSYFGSWASALEAANLPPNIGGKFDETKPTILYLLDFGGFKKFGITQQTIQRRFSGAPFFTVLDQLVLNLHEALEFEALIKAGVADRAFQPNLPWFARNGKTECFIGKETKLEDLC